MLASDILTRATLTGIPANDRGPTSPSAGPAAIARQRIDQIVDWAKESPTISDALAAMLLARAGRPRDALDPKVGSLLEAARRANRSSLRRLIAQRVAPLLSQPAGGAAPRPAAVLPFTLLLKAPAGHGEKGVLFSTVEDAWDIVAHLPGAHEILADYVFVGVSAWSPANYARFVQFAGLTRDPIRICVSNAADIDAYRMFAPLVEPVPMMASDWLDPREFQQRPCDQRDIDLIMVAGWGRYKRHRLLFEALRHMRPDLNVVLVGADSRDRTANDIWAEARAAGVRQSLTILANRPVAEVYELLGRARVKVLCSAREGSCVAVSEALFADTPVALMRGARVGTMAHINRETGVLLDRPHMAAQLDAFIERADDYSARAWAERNISCHRSSERLNELLRTAARRAGQPWTTDLAPLYWRYFAAHYVRPDDADRLAPAREEFAARYGVRLTNVAAGATA